MMESGVGVVTSIPLCSLHEFRMQSHKLQTYARPIHITKVQRSLESLACVDTKDTSAVPPAFLQGHGRITRGRLLFWVSYKNLFCNSRLPLTDQYSSGTNSTTALCFYRCHCFPSSRLPYPVLPIPQVAVSVLSTNELWAPQLKT